jgi:riboflavin kinase/FMN adenylyltransferase
MKVLNDITQIPNAETFVLTIGNFDGVHLGHIDLLEQTKRLAKIKNSKVAVMTFLPHPMTILGNAKDRFLLITNEKKRELLALQGIDYLIEVNFNRDLSTLSPKDFLQKHILTAKTLKALMLGFNFSFGAKKAGTHEVVKEILKDLQSAVELHVATGFEQNGEIISSSKIRSALDSGNVLKASQYLNRPHSIKGLVVKGDGRGRTIGFPTANIKVPEGQFYPRPGVYVTKTKYKDMFFHSLTNIGFRPTFADNSALQFETHILNFHQMIYGEEIEVEFHSQIREEKKFSSINDLVEQIKLDQQVAMSYWKEN